mmetsp:Transcript_11484/g.49484  ORF Transcript_11484/g.49484 Transcript_11484/m.49484 type:complete len:277 (+) Transcript_11484:575-1405(+)
MREDWVHHAILQFDKRVLPVSADVDNLGQVEALRQRADFSSQGDRRVSNHLAFANGHDRSLGRVGRHGGVCERGAELLLVRHTLEQIPNLLVVVILGESDGETAELTRAVARVQSIVRLGVRRRDPAHGESGEWKLGRLRRQRQNTKVLFREGVESVIKEVGRLTLVRPVDAEHRDPDRHRLFRRVILIVPVASSVTIRRRHEVVVSCQVVLTSERSRLLDVHGFHRHHADKGHLTSFSFLSLRDQHALLPRVIERPRYERRERVFVSQPPRVIRG